MFAEGLLTHAYDDFRSHLTKRNSLLARANSQSPTDSFLSKYDALMRLIEAVTVREGLRFGDSPHLAMKRIVRHIDPRISRADLDLVTSERHKAKKSRVRPSPEAERLLDSWNEGLPLSHSVSELLRD